jgi:hypothetical protein
MKKDNKSDYTINFTRKALSYLAKQTSLIEPEAVKLVIAELKASDGYKRNLCIAYNKYARGRLTRTFQMIRPKEPILSNCALQKLFLDPKAALLMEPQIYYVSAFNIGGVEFLSECIFEMGNLGCMTAERYDNWLLL